MIPAYVGAILPQDKELEEAMEQTIVKFESLNDDLKVTEAYLEVMNLVSMANKYIQDTAPWALAKDESKKDELASCMNHLARVLFEAGMLLKPILITKSDKIFDQLGVPADKRIYEAMHDLSWMDGIMSAKGEQLFPRLDQAQEEASIAEMMNGPKEEVAA